MRAMVWRGLLAACAGLFPAALVQAQEVLDEVVVSASRSEQRAFDVPAAVQGIGASAIRQAGPQINLSESINRAPGVVVLDRQNYAQDLQLSVRGFGARSTFGIRGVRLIVDGIPATMPDGQGQASTISLPSAERIEVLRGPLAQLYGNAAGGVVQVFTQSGPRNPFAAASLNLGSFGLQRWGFQTGGQHEQLNYFVDYSDMAIDGYRQNSAASRRHLNGKWRIELGQNTRLTLVANAFDQPMGLDPLGLTRAQFEADPRQAITLAGTQNTGKKVAQNQLGSVLDHALDSNNHIRARLYFGTRELYSKLAVPLAAQAAPTSAGGIVDLERRYQGLALQYSNRLATSIGRFDSVVGMDFDWMNDRRRGYLNSGGIEGALKRDENNTVDSFDLYAQTNWLVHPRWSITAGVRSSRVRFGVQDFFIASNNPDDSGSTRYRATNPVLGVTHFFSDTVNVYANLGRGFETPTFTELAYRPGALTGPNFELNASRSRHYEAGAKARLSANHRLDAAIFQIDTRDEIAVDSNTGGRSVFRNAGRTQRRGIELAYTGRLGNDWRTHAALSVMRAEFVDSFTSAAGPVQAGNSIPAVPNRFLFAELGWRPRSARYWQGLDAALEFVHSGRLLANDSNTDATDTYSLFNLRAGLEQSVGAWRIAEFVRLNNVGNRRYVGSVIVNEGNARFFEPAPGRNWVAGLTVRYVLN